MPDRRFRLARESNVMKRTRQLKLTLEDCECVTDWMLWLWPAGPADRVLNRRLCEAVEVGRGRQQRERQAISPSVDIDMPLSLFGLSPDEHLVLDQSGIRTLGDLLQLAGADLLALPDFDAETLRGIEAELDRQGLRLGMLPGEAALPVATDEARTVLNGFRQMELPWRDDSDVRIARQIAAFLNVVLDSSFDEDVVDHEGPVGIPEPEPTDEIISDDTVSFDLDDIELHTSDGDEIDFDEIDLDEAFEGAEPGSGPDAIDPGSGPAPGSGGIGDESAPDRPEKGPWPHGPDWKPDDPDAWKEDTADDDADYWKPGSDTDDSE